jgi:hypothetical protein
MDTVMQFEMKTDKTIQFPYQYDVYVYGDSYVRHMVKGSLEDAKDHARAICKSGLVAGWYMVKIQDLKTFDVVYTFTK